MSKIIQIDKYIQSNNNNSDMLNNYLDLISDIKNIEIHDSIVSNTIEILSNRTELSRSELNIFDKAVDVAIDELDYRKPKYIKNNKKIICPKCKNTCHIDSIYMYCPYCGQKLKFRKE